MLRLLVTLIVWTCASLAWAAAPHDQNICRNVDARKVIAQTGFVQAMPAFAKVVSETQIVLLGELHFDLVGSRKKVIETLAPMFGGKKTCFFYELRSNKSIGEHLADMRRPNYEMNLEQFGEIHRAAKAAGFVEITVDSPNEDDYLMDLSDLNARNEIMARNMAQALKSGRCEKGLMIVGKAHLAREGETWTTIQKYLESHAVTSTAVNLQNSKERVGFSSYAELASWNGVCPKRTGLPTPQDLRFFAHKDLPRGLVFQPIADRPTGSWSDFNYTILLPVR